MVPTPEAAVPLEAAPTISPGGSQSSRSFNTTHLRKFTETIAQTVAVNIARIDPAAVNKELSRVAAAIEDNPQHRWKRDLRMKIEEAKKQLENLAKQKAHKFQQQNQIEDEEAEECKGLVREILELQTAYEKLKSDGEDNRSYVKVFGHFLSRDLMLDWKSVVGEVRCPAGHLVSSINNDDENNNTICDFWNCAAKYVNPL